MVLWSLSRAETLTEPQARRCSRQTGDKDRGKAWVARFLGKKTLHQHSFPPPPLLEFQAMRNGIAMLPAIAQTQTKAERKPQVLLVLGASVGM